MIGISGSPFLSKTLMELILTPVVNFGEVRRAQLTKSTLLISTLVPLGSFQIFFGTVQTLKREWGAESNGKLQHLFIPSKTATFVPEFAMEDLPLGRIAVLVPEFAMKDLPLGRRLMMIYKKLEVDFLDK